jgi:DNA repair photolyase
MNSKEDDIENQKLIPFSTIEDAYKIIQTQQATINRLTSELTKKSNKISIETYEKALNDLEVIKIKMVNSLFY